MQRQDCKPQSKSSTSVKNFSTTPKRNAKLIERKPKPIVASSNPIHKGAYKQIEIIGEIKNIIFSGLGCAILCLLIVTVTSVFIARRNYKYRQDNDQPTE